MYAGQADEAAPLAAGDSEIGFVALGTGDQSPGTFPVSELVATLDATTPANSSIGARVETSNVTSPNAQMAGSPPNAEWFDAETLGKLGSYPRLNGLAMAPRPPAQSIRTANSSVTLAPGATLAIAPETGPVPPADGSTIVHALAEQVAAGT